MTAINPLRLLCLSAATGALVLGAAAVAVAASPGVAFVSPATGTTVSTPVNFTVKLTNFTIDKKDVGKKPIAGKGHLHFAMDKGKFDFPKYSGANGALAVTLGTQGKYSPALAPTITYKGLPKGKHTLVVYLANNNHTNVGPKASVSVTVK